MRESSRTSLGIAVCSGVCSGTAGESSRSVTLPRANTIHTAFVWRKGYPRRIPDKGTYWHLGQEVSYLPSKARAYEHPQIKKEPRQGPLGKQDYEELVDHKIAERRAKREVRRAELDRKREARVRKSVKRWKDD